MKLDQILKKFHFGKLNKQNSGNEKDHENDEILTKVSKLRDQLDIQNTEIPMKNLIDGRHKNQDPADN